MSEVNYDDPFDPSGDKEFEDIGEPSGKGGNYARFDNAGEFYAGVVVELDLYDGQTTFDGDPCGFIKLQDEVTDEVTTLTLDKKKLLWLAEKAVNEGIAHSTGVHLKLEVGVRLKVVYIGLKKLPGGGAFKNFKFLLAPPPKKQA